MEKVTFLVNNVREFDWLMENLAKFNVTWVSLDGLYSFYELLTPQLNYAMEKKDVAIELDVDERVITWNSQKKMIESPKGEYFTIRYLMEHKEKMKGIFRQEEENEPCYRMAMSDEHAKSSQSDPIKPKHYDGEIEPVDVAEDWGLNFNEGSVMKYIRRAGHKYDTEDEKLKKHLEDLQKADHFLQREIKLIANKAGVIL